MKFTLFSGLTIEFTCQIREETWKKSSTSHLFVWRQGVQELRANG